MYSGDWAMTLSLMKEYQELKTDLQADAFYTNALAAEMTTDGRNIRPALCWPDSDDHGGARGSACHSARRLLKERGFRLWDIDGSSWRRHAARLPVLIMSAAAVDVADETSVTRATASTYTTFGQVDILINNAGILGPVDPLWEQTPADFRRVLEVNLVGMHLVCRAIVPRMRVQTGRPRGRIVNISSVQGKEGLALSGAYGISKAGVIALTKILGKELAADGIMVNCVTPAAAETDMALELTPARRAEIVSRIPMGPLCRGRRDRGHGRFSSVGRVRVLNRCDIRSVRRARNITEQDRAIVTSQGAGAIIIWNDITPEGRADVL